MRSLRPRHIRLSPEPRREVSPGVYPLESRHRSVTDVTDRFLSGSPGSNRPGDSRLEWVAFGSSVDNNLCERVRSSTVRDGLIV